MPTIYRCVDEQEGVVASILRGGMFEWEKRGEVKLVEGRREILSVVSALVVWAY